MVGEVEGVTALDAKEVVIDAALVAIVTTHDLHAGIGTAYPERCLAAIATVRTDGADMLHLPGPRLIPVGPGSQCADRAYIDTHAALFALEMIFFIGCDDRTDAAVLHAQGPHVHAFAADAHAAITEDAAGAVEEHHRRPLLLFLMIL